MCEACRHMAVYLLVLCCILYCDIIIFNFLGEGGGDSVWGWEIPVPPLPPSLYKTL